MTTQEIREMLDSTINSNGKREISGQSLNAALNAILDLVENAESATTILLPNDDSFAEDNTDASFLENNIKAFNALLAQRIAYMPICVRYNNQSISPNPVFRLRQKDGAWYDYTIVVWTNNYFMAGPTYRLYSDGTVAKVDELGQVLIAPDGLPPFDDSILIGSYNQTATSTNGSTLPTSYLPRLLRNESRDLMIENPFGNYLSKEVVLPVLVSRNKIVLKGGWSHPKFGEMTNDIAFTVGYDENGQFDGSLTMKNPVTFGGGAEFDTYVMNKI